MENIILSILEINSDINLQYRISKKPKFINDIIAKRRRNKVKSAIEKIHKLKTIDCNIIKDYINILYRQYPPYGTYKNCLKIESIENKNEEMLALFKFSINEDGKDVGLVALSPDSKLNTYLIRFVWSNNGITKFANAQENVKVLNNTETYNERYPYSAKIENEVIKDCFCKCIIDNIYDFLMEDVERSERAVKYDGIKIE